MKVTQRWKDIFEVVAILLALGLFFVTWVQTCATRDSVTLTRQALEGSQGAVLTLQAAVTRPPDGRYVTPPSDIEVMIANERNRIAGVLKGGELVVQRYTMSFDKPFIEAVGEPSSLKLAGGVVTADRPKQESFPIPDLIQHFQELSNLRQTLLLKISYTYNNGFDREVSEHICYQVIANLGVPDLVFGGFDTVRCDQVPRRLYDYRFHQEQKQKQQQR